MTKFHLIKRQEQDINLSLNIDVVGSVQCGGCRSRLIQIGPNGTEGIDPARTRRLAASRNGGITRSAPPMQSPPSAPILPLLRASLSGLTGDAEDYCPLRTCHLPAQHRSYHLWPGHSARGLLLGVFVPWQPHLSHTGYQSGSLCLIARILQCNMHGH